MRRLKRSSSKRGSSSLTQDSNNPKQKTGTTSSTLQSLHTELQVLADGAGDSSVSSPPPQQTGGIQRLLKGKKLVRVKRVPARNVSADTLEGVSSTDTGGKKVLRVKVKRKKKEETDTAESPPPRRGGSSRRGRSDASVGTGIVSRAKSWFTFGGMKVGSGGKDFLGVEDEDDDDDEEDFGGRTEYGDEYTTDMRTTTQDEVTTAKEEQTTVVVEEQPQQSLPPKATTAASTVTTTSTTNNNASTTPKAAVLKPKVAAPKSPVTTPRRASSLRSSSTKKQHVAPVQEIIPQSGVPRKLPLTGVALRRLQIQEEWLSKGCNFKPNEFLRSTTAAQGKDDDDDLTDISDISNDDPILLVMGPDAPTDREVAFWTQTTATYKSKYGHEHGRTAECLLNQGVAALNARETSSAIECFLEAVNLLQDKYGETSLAAARALHLLGSAFFLEGQLQMAVEATRKSLEIRKTALGPFHTDTVDTFSNLAMVYLKLGRLTEATRIFNEVLQIRKAIYNAWHPSVAFPARSLGAVYAKRKDKDRAMESYAHALKCFQQHGMLSEYMDTEAEMRRFGIHPPVEYKGRTEI